MKKLSISLLLLIALCGCSADSRELDRGFALRTRLAESSGICFDADITADYGDKLYSFSMNCQTDSEGNMMFTVTQPETISGITGKITAKGGALTFDDAALHFALLTDEQLSPVSSPWILIKTLRSGYMRSACREEEGLHLTIDDTYEADALMLDIWLDEENLPKRAEIVYDSRRILSLQVKNAKLL